MQFYLYPHHNISNIQMHCQSVVTGGVQKELKAPNMHKVYEYLEFQLRSNKLLSVKFEEIQVLEHSLLIYWFL